MSPFDFDSFFAQYDAICRHVHVLCAALAIVTALLAASLSLNVYQISAGAPLYSDADRAEMTDLIRRSIH